MNTSITDPDLLKFVYYEIKEYGSILDVLPIYYKLSYNRYTDIEVLKAIKKDMIYYLNNGLLSNGEVINTIDIINNRLGPITDFYPKSLA